jgi:Protein of unknown function (DUF3107)
VKRVDVRIGIIHTGKELDVELGEGVDRDQLLDDIGAVLGKDDGVIWLTDKRGRRVGVPANKIAYVEVGGAVEERRVGFGTP